MEKSDKIKCQVSSFVDGEITEGEVSLLCKRITNDQALRERWRDYHVISDALKQQLPAHANVDLSQRIHDALEDEPALSGERKAVSNNRTVVKRFSGLAVAASVAILGVVVVLNTAVQPGGSEPTVLAKSTPDTVVTQVAGLSSNPIVTERTIDPRLNKYLVDHSEYAVSASVHGMLPYARIVGQQSVRE